ncbi:MAG: hypothetical protein UW80_C0042G0009 [Microgenomates group bacterium GW2011_GWC1_44_9]|nr:MAG: hypothetical protein UW80_C0042G0009 [Microgenomates group bacterium GW2011_GWC1_44_9]
MAYPLNAENYEKCLESIVKHLSGKFFNILTETDSRRLRFCNRELKGKVVCKNGQVSILLKPGGSIAWDINTEIVGLEFGGNGDILLYRESVAGWRKTILITQSPI